MKYVVIYRPDSEHGRIVEEFVREFSLRHGDATVELQNIDRRDGSALASLYDIVQYPAILALRDDGSALRVWEGSQLPLMDEVASYQYS